MKPLRICLLLLALSLGALARDRQITLVVGAPQGKFPPPWTESVRVSVLDSDTLIQDHRYIKKGQKDYRFVLVGPLYNQEYTLEFLCLGRAEKPVAVFHHKIRLKKDLKKLELKKMEFLEIIRD